MTTLSRYQTIQWKNTIVNLHDCICNCNSGIKHTLLLLTNEEITTTKEEKAQIIKCLTTGEEDNMAKEETGFDDGDLEALFAGDDGAGEEGER